MCSLLKLRLHIFFQSMKTVETCFSPGMYQHKLTADNYIVAVIDVLRATTAFCAAFDSGVQSIVPVPALDDLLTYKNKGFLTAAERDGKKVDFADFGNSPTVFLQNNLSGRDLAYSTTNGTLAIEMAKDSGRIVAVAFVNLDAVANWLIHENSNVVILCSGWKNSFSLEDSLCAGALIDLLLKTGKYNTTCDSSQAAHALWQKAKSNLLDEVKKASHYKRLAALGHKDDLRHCFNLNSSASVPIFNKNAFYCLAETD